jgi:hypothetical protein
MATEVKSWRANDGSLHDDKVVAAQRDVELLVTEIMWPGADVEHISEKLIENREHVIRVLTEYHRLAPPTAPRGEASAESSEGPVVEESDIPPMVYWDAENSNFYGATSRRGQGQIFFDQWYPRRAEFPQSYGDCVNGD